MEQVVFGGGRMDYGMVCVLGIEKRGMREREKEIGIVIFAVVERRKRERERERVMVVVVVVVWLARLRRLIERYSGIRCFYQKQHLL